MMATFHPESRHRLATPEAADPVPITVRSKFFGMIVSLAKIPTKGIGTEN
jgi:hypothetical protein